MPLFPCSQCGVAENTATSDFWSAFMDGTPPLCSQCDPTIGKWHGLFDRHPATELAQMEVKKGIDAGWFVYRNGNFINKKSKDIALMQPPLP